MPTTPWDYLGWLVKMKGSGWYELLWVEMDGEGNHWYRAIAEDGGLTQIWADSGMSHFEHAAEPVWQRELVG